jgi:hypothetical protein
MQPEVRQATLGKCRKCGMALVPEGARFALLQHMIRNPRMLVALAAIMAAVMVVAMMMR